MCRPKGVKNKTFHWWSDEEKEYLKEIRKGRSYKEIASAMNEKFNIEYTETQIGAALKRYKLTNGINRRFKKGIVPWNKGIKGYMGANGTSFKSGDIPPNWRPVGSERIKIDGYTEVKVEGGKWKLKHRLKYEEYHGEIPKDYVIIFANGDKGNFSKENLIAISRNKLKTMNKYNLIKSDIETTKTGTVIADIIIKTEEVRKRARK